MIKKVFVATRALALCVTLALFAVVGLCYGQNTDASLNGTVTDTTKAAIPGATLTLTNEATGISRTATTDATGGYNITTINPGKYDLTVSAPGFKTTINRGIELTISQIGRVNAELSLGQTHQTVTVTAGASAINFTDATLGGGIAPETLQNFPLMVSGAPRSSATVALMLPGVTTGASGNAYNAQINGGLVSGDEALVDGATAMEGFMNQSGMVSLETDFGMSPDITSEVTVLTADYPAQYGNTTSGQIIIQTRSGGSQFHGSAYDYLSNRALNAFQYGAPVGVSKPEDTQNDYGANIGGPIVKGPFMKGYFYFSWEGFKEAGGANSATLTIPSLNDRAGNFGGAGTQLYYPADLVKYGADAGQPIDYNGQMNQINPLYEDPVAKAWMAELPTPTSGGETNNYFIPKSGQGSLTNSENVYFGRVDFNVGRKDHLYYSTWWQYTGVNSESDLPVAISTAQPADPENANIERLNWEHSFSDTMNNHATVGYLNRNEGYFALNGKADLPTVSGTADASFLPTFTIDGYTQLGNPAGPNAAATLTTRGTWAFNDVFTKVAGTHTITAGFQWHLAGTTIRNGFNQGGSFEFGQDTTGNQNCPPAAPCPGSGAATFYLGAVSSGNVNYYNVLAAYPRQDGWAAFAGDTWRLNPKLTLNYSLRWDYITPFREKYNNFSFFDPNGLNPGAVTSGGQELPGRLAFAGSGFGAASYGARYPEIPFRDALSPRVGFAYAINPTTVVRAGYGIFFGQAFYPGWNAGLGQDGFNKNYTVSETPSNGLQVPALYLNTGINPANVGPTKDISASFDNGQTPSVYRPLDGNRRPYSAQWNLTVGKQFHEVAVTMSYVGTKGTHLPSALSPLNVLNPDDQAISAIGPDLSVNYSSPGGPATFAKYGVSVPYVGWVNQMTGCAPTIGQALVPYPQYCGTLQGLNEGHGNSIYNSFQTQVERRFRQGLYLLASLTVSKMYTNATYSTQSVQDRSGSNNGSFSPFHPEREWALSPTNVPIAFQLSSVYNLPFGRNQRFLNSSGRLLNAVVGGWQVSPLYRYEYGTPLSFQSSSCPTASLAPYFRESCAPGILPGQLPLLHGRNGFNPAKTNGQYLNPRAFESNFSTFGYTGYGKSVSTVYGPAYQDVDLAFAKNVKISGRVDFKFTANFFNLLNNHYFVTQGNGPGSAFNTDVAAPGNSFGQWNGTVSNPRNIQVAGRISF